MEIISRIRLSFQKEKPLREALHSILGFWPRDIAPYQLALMHRGGNSAEGNNERLEFLGDAILSAVVADIVYHRFTHDREGFLTSTRSRIVSRETLNRVAHSIGLVRMVKNVRLDQMDGTSVPGNTLEALLGAIYLDRGYKGCHRFVHDRLMHRFISLDEVAQQDTNYKSRLLEFCQKRRLNLEYRVEPMTTPEGDPAFRATVVIDGKDRGTGTGSSKKAATQAAASKALRDYSRRQNNEAAPHHRNKRSPKKAKTENNHTAEHNTKQ